MSDMNQTPCSAFIHVRFRLLQRLGISAVIGRHLSDQVPSALPGWLCGLRSLPIQFLLLGGEPIPTL